MEDFIGNNISTIVKWGQSITVVIILACIYLFYVALKKRKSSSRHGLLFYLAIVPLFLLLFVSSFALVRITKMKPRATFVLNELESLHNKPAPPLEFNLLATGSKKSINDYRGKVVLLNFWATWCAPCLKEMPELSRLQNDYKEKGLIVLALSDEDKERLEKFASKKAFEVTVAYSKKFTWADIQSERPITFLVNKKGVIVDYFTGGYGYDFFESKIKDYLND